MGLNTGVQGTHGKSQSSEGDGWRLTTVQGAKLYFHDVFGCWIILIKEKFIHGAGTLRIYSLPRATDTIFLLYLIRRTEGFVNQTERNCCCLDSLVYFFTEKRTPDLEEGGKSRCEKNIKPHRQNKDLSVVT